MKMRTASDVAQRRIGIAEVRLRTNASTSTINRWVRAGTFPAPHYLGVRRCWLESEVTAWLESWAERRVAREERSAAEALTEQKREISPAEEV